MGGKGARFIISAFSRYKDYKISDPTQSNRYSSVPNPDHYRTVLFSLGPGSAVGKKGEKRGQIGKKSASRAVSWGRLSYCLTTSRLASLANFVVVFFLANADFFPPFSYNAEPGPGLKKT